MFTDTIADYLTRVRNAQMVGHKVVEIPSSNMKKAITEILHEKGYILNFKFEDTENNKGNIKVALKYNAQTNLPAIRKLTRISKPGLRKYLRNTEIPQVRNGLGVLIVSTSKGLMTDRVARKEKLGGEALCAVW